MTDTYRYRYGDANPVAAPYKAGVPIELGDLCQIDAADGNTIKPAGSFTWTTDLATTQTNYHLVFMGVAMQSYDGAATPAAAPYGLRDGKIRLGTEGVYEFDCASANFAEGDLVGPAKQSGNLLEPQKVVAVATELLAIGRVQEGGTALTRVKVRIGATKMALRS